MSELSNEVAYLVFDIESVADGELVSRLQYPGEDLSGDEAISRYRAELLEQKGSDFIPYTFHLPVSVVIAKISRNFELLDLVALDQPEFRPHVITKLFWRGWEHYNCPTFVTFNGRGFDIPLMEVAAFRYGLSLGRWFALDARSFDQPRYRYNTDKHFDLYEVLTNYGASRFNGGLNLAANLIGKPGKMDVKGSMVQDLYQDGKLAEINDYCRCDVLDTYFVFLRSMVLTGRISLEREQEIVANTQSWILAEAERQPVFKQYLEQWGDWENPWREE